MERPPSCIDKEQIPAQGGQSLVASYRGPLAAVFWFRKQTTQPKETK